MFDASWDTAPSGLPGPTELLASAFAACLLKNLNRAGRLLSFRYGHAVVDVTARRQDAPPKFTEISYEPRLATSEPQRRIDLLHRNLRRYGTVYNTLAAACDVHGTVTAAPLAPPRAGKPGGASYPGSLLSGAGTKGPEDPGPGRCGRDRRGAGRPAGLLRACCPP